MNLENRLETEFVMRIHAECAPTLAGGPGALGSRRHIQITGGLVEGPEIQGRILPGGSDWALTRPDGSAIVDAHYSILIDGAIPVYVHNRGLRVSTPEVSERLLRGDAVEPNEYYFRSTPVFDAPLGRLEFLNDHVFAARCERRANTTIIDVFKIC